MNPNLLTAQDLRALKRPTVQRIAKVCTVLQSRVPCLFGIGVADCRHGQREGIRATGKTEDIIAALLDAYPGRVEP